RTKGTRPMTDRAREALFSTLGPVVEGARVLDLYAGSGSLGLESLSRGAASAVFVERHRRALKALRANVDSIGLGGRVIADDVEHFLEQPDGVFDLAFVDPPYALSLASVETVLDRLVPRLEEGAQVVLHRRAGDSIPTAPPALRPVDRRRHGDSELHRFVRGGQA
ncbi:MAG: 16S rRNA (guanine(966)-N(2))-methyltransferase RsmD, partial [Acidimicrobiia bacterium]